MRMRRILKLFKFPPVRYSRPCGSCFPAAINMFAMLGTRLNPLWLLAAGGAAGGLGFLA
jgi:hypothetical protein